MVSKKDWRNLPLEDWTVTTFHAFAIEMSKEMHGVEYAPGGQGSIGERWRREQGMLKTEQKRYGNEVLKKWLITEYENYVPSAQFPSTNVWFLMTYRKDGLQKAQYIVNEKRKRREANEVDEHVEYDEEWF